LPRFIVLFGLECYHIAMDSTAQQPQQDTNVSAPPAQSQAIPVSVPMGGKEQEVLPVVGAQASHPEIVIPEVVKEAGVKAETATDHEIHLTEDQRQAGLSPSGSAVPVEPNPFHSPLSESKVQKILLKPNFNESLTWLATLFRKILQRQRSQA